MHSQKKHCRTLGDVYGRINYYFYQARSEIAEKNLGTLRAMCLSVALLGMGLALIAPILVPGWKPTVEYYRLVPTVLIFLAFSIIYKKQRVHNYYVVQGACILFYALLLYHFIDISVFSYPDMPDTYVCLSLMMIPVVFIMRPEIIISITFAGGLTFGLLAKTYKVGVAVPHDRFAVVATFIYAAIAMLIVLNLRINDYSLRERYMLRSRMDQLTGLLNKRSYERYCQKALRAKSYDASCALIVFDVDDFKDVNDRRGHIIGDRTLEIIGEVMTETFRTSDYVGRIGGDEFSALVLPGSDDACLSAMAQRVLDEVALRTEDEIGQRVTLSVGIALRERSDAYYEKLFIAADTLLYNAKNTRSGGIQIKKF